MRTIALAATVTLALFQTAQAQMFSGVTGLEAKASGNRQIVRFEADLPFEYQKQVLSDNQILLRIFNARLADAMLSRDGYISLNPNGLVESAVLRPVSAPGANYQEVVLTGKNLGKANLIVEGATEATRPLALQTAQAKPAVIQTRALADTKKTSAANAGKPKIVFPQNTASANSGGRIEPVEPVSAPDAETRAQIDDLLKQVDAAEKATQPQILSQSSTPGGKRIPAEAQKIIDARSQKLSEGQPDPNDIDAVLADAERRERMAAMNTIASPVTRSFVPGQTGKAVSGPQTIQAPPAVAARPENARTSRYPNIAALETPASNQPQPSAFYPESGLADGETVYANTPGARPDEPEIMTALPRYRGGAKPIEAVTYDSRGRAVKLRPVNQAGTEMNLETGTSGYNALFQADEPGTTGTGNAVSRLMGKALESYQKNDLETAYRQITEALGLDADNASIYAALGEIQIRRNLMPQAVEAYHHASERAPEKYDQRYAQVLALAGKRKEAVAVLEDLVIRKPKLASAVYMLGTLYEEMGDTQKALPHLEKAAELNPSSADVNYNLGLAYELLGETSQAEKAYRKALDLNPAAEDAIKALARVKP